MEHLIPFLIPLLTNFLGLTNDFEAKVDKTPVKIETPLETQEDKIMEFCPECYLGVWRISTYYTPVKDQVKYFNGSYEADFKVNCSGDCFVTASGYHLTDDDALRIVACPRPYNFGDRFWIEGVGMVSCQDRGGLIKQHRLDLFVGTGNNGYNRIGKGSGWKKVFLMK